MTIQSRLPVGQEYKLADHGALAARFANAGLTE
jgi:hypothetical protein